MNLTGSWYGQYTYGKEYPEGIAGTSEPFEITIKDVDGIISGPCIDDIVKSKEGNESSIEGTFKENDISFFKRYKYNYGINESGEYIPADYVKFDGVQYEGKLKKKLFSRKIYFTGKWTITAQYTLDDGSIHILTTQRTWEMSKVKSLTK